MALKDNPGLTTMPLNARDWTKFINELSIAIGEGGVPIDPTPPDYPEPPTADYVTLTTNQTITGLKTFTGNNPRWNSFPLWNNDNVGTQIGLLTEDTSPQPTDLVVTTDNKKVALSRIHDEAYAFFMDD
jgi:hypothetical protein